MPKGKRKGQNSPFAQESGLSEEGRGLDAEIFYPFEGKSAKSLLSSCNIETTISALIFRVQRAARFAFVGSRSLKEKGGKGVE